MHTFRIALTLIVITAFIGCKKEEPIVSYSTPKAPPSVALTQETSDVALPKIPGASYTAPGGWVAAAPHEFEVGRFDASGDGTTFVTVAQMGPQFDLGPNIARWQKQVDVGPTTPSLPTSSTVGGVEAKSLDLKGKDKRLIVTIVGRPDATLIFKLLGPSAAVEAARPGFEAFLQSIHFDAPPAEPATVSPPFVVTPPVAATPLPFMFTAPPQWTVDPTPHSMRAMTWSAGSGADRVEIYISGPFTAATFDATSNKEMWRKQADLPDGADVPLTDVTVGNLPGKMVDVTGPSKRLVVAYAGRDDFWFFKMQGSPAAVAAQKPVFDKFLASVKFNP